MKTPIIPLDDIAGEQEIRQMVDAFYETVRKDQRLGPVFESHVNDWSKHLATMYSFWGSILFGTVDYHGNPFAKHMPLSVDHAHFERWIELFIETVDRLFSGPKAEHAKGAGRSIAHSFQLRMGINPFSESNRIY